MRRSACRRAGAAVLILPALVGCQATSAKLLNVIGLQRKPVGLVLVADARPGTEPSVLTVLNPFSSYNDLRRALSKEIDRPVPMDLCFAMQLPFYFSSGASQLALLSAPAYASLSQPERYPVLAVPADEQGRLLRAALLIVPADSPLQTVADLRGRKVAFGPAGDGRRHAAALELLAQHGLPPQDLSREWLPLPGGLLHSGNDGHTIELVLHGGAEAGFIDEETWEALPEEPISVEAPARNRLRVVARTRAIPDWLFVCSPQLDEDLRVRVRDALLGLDEHHPEALKALAVARYEEPTGPVLDACRQPWQFKAAAENAPGQPPP